MPRYLLSAPAIIVLPAVLLAKTTLVVALSFVLNYTISSKHYSVYSGILGGLICKIKTNSCNWWLWFSVNTYFEHCKLRDTQYTTLTCNQTTNFQRRSQIFAMRKKCSNWSRILMSFSFSISDSGRWVSPKPRLYLDVNMMGSAQYSLRLCVESRTDLYFFQAASYFTESPNGLQSAKMIEPSNQSTEWQN